MKIFKVSNLISQISKNVLRQLTILSAENREMLSTHDSLIEKNHNRIETALIEMEDLKEKTCLR